MPLEATMATEMLAPCLRALSKLGAAVEQRAIATGLEILGRDGLRIAAFSDLKVRIPHRTGLSLLDNAIALSRDPAFALHAAAGAQPGDFGLFEMLTRSAPTLGFGMQVAARYLPLLHDGASITLERDGERVLWRHRLRPGLPSSPGAHDYVVAAFTFMTMRATGLDIPPLEVSFVHPAPTYAKKYAALFRTAVRFGCTTNVIALPALALDVPLATADAALHAVLTRYADEQLLRLPSLPALSQRVRDLLRAGLPHAVSLADLTTHLHMSESTVQRKLRAEGTTHSELLDALRRELSLELLAQGELDVAEIAFRLGFAHPPAFHRAFKRWQGMSPTEHRERGPRSAFYRFHT
jgi:AraC-like DNA-binding protein